jgi:two-component system, response regulator YesN
MITILVVDDEMETREGIKKYVPWDKLGIHTVVQAENGLAAINLCESIHPDILLTDVRMPQMDGIQLATYIRERFPNCKIIFLSGFSDKQYLKSAIRLGAINYIEKPIDVDELTSVLSEAVILLSNEILRKEEELMLQSMVSENLPLIHQKLAVDAAYKTIDLESAENVYPILRNMVNRQSDVCSVIVKLHEAALLAEEEREFYRLGMLTFLHQNSALKSEFACLIPGFLDNNKLLIHCINEKQGTNSLQTKILMLIRMLQDRYEDKYIFSAVVGKPVSSFSEITVSAQTALKQLQRLFFMKKGYILFYAPASNPVYIFNETDFETYQQLIQGNNSIDVLNFLDKLTTNISAFPDTDTGYVKNMYFKLFMSFIQTAEKRNIKINIPELEGVYVWEEISKMDTIFDATSYLHTLIKEYFAVMENKKEGAQRIFSIMDYIEKHFSDQNLSIRGIAEYAHYDHYYMCTLFKKHTGKTLNDYITQVRVEKAKELLRNKIIKLSDITVMVGYSDPSYFSRIFKRLTGFSPSEFREKYLL